MIQRDPGSVQPDMMRLSSLIVIISGNEIVPNVFYLLRFSSFPCHQDVCVECDGAAEGHQVCCYLLSDTDYNNQSLSRRNKPF